MPAPSTGERLITVFFSSPGDLADDRLKLAMVVEDMRPIFARHGISLRSWLFERDAVPGVGSSPQSVIDKQLLRNSDGALAFDLYVGLMGDRIGTPLADAESGTVHEFIEAREAFYKTGKPHILFYFRESRPGQPADDFQVEAVRRFRAQYPGLFATFQSISDLQEQFRRHLLSELLDLSLPTAVPSGSAAGEWSELLVDRYVRLRAKTVTFLDISPEKPPRIIRQLHELLGIHYHLSPREEQILLGALYCWLLGTADRTQTKELLGGPELLDEVTKVIDAAGGALKPGLLPKGPARLDLIAVLLQVGLRLDITRKGISAAATSQPDFGAAPTQEWLAYLTGDIVCQRGLVRFHLLAPSDRWITPLIAATAVAMEGLWQGVRSVLTQHDMSFAVARPQIEIAPELDILPDLILGKIQMAAEEAKRGLPEFPHFGESSLPVLEELLPLPVSRVRESVTFYLPATGRGRLLVGGNVVEERPEGKSERIEFRPPADEWVECVLEGDQVGEFVPITRCRVRRLGAIEQAVLESSKDNSEAFRTIGLWNDLLQLIWPRINSSQADHSDLSDAFHILREALDAASQDDMPLDRRDLYWDAIRIVGSRITQKEVTR